MKPDIRPVTILTRAILDTSPAWVLLTAGNGYIYPSAGLRLDGALLMAPDGLCFSDHQRCYPCKADAPFEPIPWPLMHGEVEIEEWRKLGLYEPELTSAGINRPSKWVLGTVFAEYRLDIRPGYHPVPRRQINPDGTETPVWVWEKDR